MSTERRDGQPNCIVSVSVVTHNQREWILDTLQSVSAQRCSFPIEVVIADDASTDGTREAALEWAAAYDGMCRVLPPAERLGVSANHRRAFAAARGDAIAVIEGDDVWIRSDKLERQYSTLSADPSLAMVASRHVIVDGSGAAGFISPQIEAAAFRSRFTSDDLADSNWFGTFSTSMFRREAVERIRDEVWQAGPYDWLLAMAVTEWGDALLLGEVATAYRQHRGGVWSSESAESRARALRLMIPTYREVLGGRLDSALSRVEWHLDYGIAQMEEAPERDASSRDALGDAFTETFAFPLPHPEPVPELSMVIVVEGRSTPATGVLESLIGPANTRLELIAVSIDDAEAQSTWAPSSDPRIRQFRLPHRTDRISALNLGIQQARSEVVAILDSEDLPDRELIAQQVGQIVSGDADVVVVRPDGVATIDDPHQWQRAVWDTLDENWSRALVRVSSLDGHGLFDPTLGDHCFVDRWSALASRVRIIGADSSWVASSGRRPSDVATAIETLDRVIDRVVEASGLGAFRDLTRPYPADDAVRRECLMIGALLADTSTSSRVRWAVGARRLRRALGSPAHRRVLRIEHQLTEFYLLHVERSVAGSTTRAGAVRVWAEGRSIASRLLRRFRRVMVRGQ